MKTMNPSSMVISGRFVALFVASFLLMLLVFQHVPPPPPPLRSALSLATTIDGAELFTTLSELRQQDLDEPHHGRTVHVDVYVESLCIDSKAYFDGQLMPTFAILGPVVMRLRVIVFGNAHIKDTLEPSSLICQHGQGAFEQ